MVELQSQLDHLTALELSRSIDRSDHEEIRNISTETILESPSDNNNINNSRSTQTLQTTSNLNSTFEQPPHPPFHSLSTLQTDETSPEEPESVENPSDASAVGSPGATHEQPSPHDQPSTPPSPSTNTNDTSPNDSSSNRQQTQHEPSTSNNRSKKEKRRTRLSAPSGNPDDGDDSSSSSSSDDDSMSSSDNDDDHSPNASTEVSSDDEAASTDDATRRTHKKCRDAGTITKYLTKSAADLGLPRLRMHTKPQRRSAEFIEFAYEFQGICDLYKETSGLFDNFPEIVLTPKYPEANQAIFKFLMKVVDSTFGSILKQYKSEHGYNGAGAFMYLRDQCLIRDPEQEHEARHKLDNLYIHPNQLLSQFNTVFAKLVEKCKFTGKALTHNQEIDAYLRSIHTYKGYDDVKFKINAYRDKRLRESTKHSDKNSKFNLLQIQGTLNTIESKSINMASKLANDNTQANTHRPLPSFQLVAPRRNYQRRASQQQHHRHNQQPPQHHQHRPRFANSVSSQSFTKQPNNRYRNRFNRQNSRANPSILRRSHSQNQTSSRHRQANSNQSTNSRPNQSQRSNNYTCYGCGGSHKLANCPTLSQDAKTEIWRRVNEERRRNSTTSTYTTRPSSNATTANATSAANPNTSISWANCTLALNSPAQVQANSVRAFPPRNPDKVTRVLDFVLDRVLLDSGASDHMHPHVDDLLHIENHENQVMLSDGSKIATHFNGILRVRLTDVDSRRHLVVPLTGCIAVPGLVNTLWSVSKFSEEGHQIIFQKDYITLVLFAFEPDRRTSIRIRAPTFVNSSGAALPIQVNHAFSFNTWSDYQQDQQEYIEADSDYESDDGSLTPYNYHIDMENDYQDAFDHLRIPASDNTNNILFPSISDDDDDISLPSLTNDSLLRDTLPPYAASHSAFEPLPSLYDSVSTSQLNKLQNIARAAQRVQPYFVNPESAYRHRCINQELAIFRRKLNNRGLLTLPDFSDAKSRDPFIWIREQLVNEVHHKIQRILHNLGDIKSRSCRCCHAPLNAKCQCSDDKFTTTISHKFEESYDHHDIAYIKFIESNYDPYHSPKECNNSPWSIDNDMVYLQSPMDSFKMQLPFTLDEIRASQAHYNIGPNNPFPGISYDPESRCLEDCRGRILIPPTWQQVLFAFIHFAMPSPSDRDQMLDLMQQRFTWRDFANAYDNYRHDQCDQLTSKITDTKRYYIQENYSVNPSLGDAYSIKTQSHFPFEITLYRKSSPDLPVSLSPDELLQYTKARRSFPKLSYDMRPYDKYEHMIPWDLQWDRDGWSRQSLDSINEISMDEAFYPFHTFRKSQTRTPHSSKAFPNAPAIPCAFANNVTAVHSTKRKSSSPPTFKRKVDIDLIHRRMSHCREQSLLAADEAGMYGDTKICTSPEKFCIGCKIGTIRRTNRGHDIVGPSSKPGSVLFADIQTNPTSTGLTSNSYFPYFLILACSYSKYVSLIGMRSMSAADVIDAVIKFSIQCRPHHGYSLKDIDEIHADAGSQFLSQEFVTWAYNEGIHIVCAAPEHQHQNGMVERPWQTIRLISNKQIVHSRLAMMFLTSSLFHATRMYNIFPHKGVFNDDGIPCTPHEKFYGTKPNLRKLRVFGCPSIIKIFTRENLAGQTLTSKNNPQRGIRAIFVGFPPRQAGWLFYVPASGHLLVSGDAAFDEDFNSTIALNHLTFHDSLPLRSPGVYHNPSLPQAWTSPPVATNISHYYEEQPLETRDIELPDTPFDPSRYPTEVIPDTITKTEDQQELSILDSPTDHDEPNLHSVQEGDSELSDDSDDDISRIQEGDTISDDDDLGHQDAQDENVTTYLTPTSTLNDTTDTSTYDKSPPPTAPKQKWPTHPTRRSTRLARRTTKALFAVANAVSSNRREQEVAAKIIKDALLTLPANLGEQGSDPSFFLPEPRSFADLYKLPIPIRNAWIRALISEIKGLVSKDTFKIEEPPKDTKAYQLMLVFKCKIDKNGYLDKLKVRLVFRGDLVPHDDVDTWNPHASWTALRIFLANCAKHRMTPSQYDFIQAYLQCDVPEPLFCRLSDKYTKHVPDNLKPFCGVGLRCLKALYGWHQSGQLLWQAVEAFFLEFGLTQSVANKALWYLHTDDGKMLQVLQYSDDGLIACNNESLKAKFIRTLKQRFDCNVSDTADWYLQSRITHDQNYNITLDQQRYCLSMLRRFLPNLPDEPSSTDLTKYANPLPYDFTWTKQDRSTNLEEVKTLEQEFGFRYIEAVGSLNWLSNTAFKQMFAIRKACKFMNLPGRNHFRAVQHLMFHMWCYPPKALKYYSDIQQAPISQFLADAGHPKLDPSYAMFTDSSFSDCDNSRSTGGYVTLYQGGIVDMGSFVPQPIAQSTCEAESNAQCLAIMASRPITKMIMELTYGDPEHPFTLPLLTDSSSSIAQANSDKTAKSSRHIERRFQYVRHAILSGIAILYFVSGNQFQLADILTKALTHLQSHKKLAIVESDPHGSLSS